MKSKIIILILVVIYTVGFTVKEDPQEAPVDPWTLMVPCTCDSGTYCLSDEDYMQIVRYNEFLKNKHSIGGK